MVRLYLLLFSSSVKKLISCFVDKLSNDDDDDEGISGDQYENLISGSESASEHPLVMLRSRAITQDIL